MWFIVVVLLGQPAPGFQQRIAGFKFPTHTACMADARERFDALRTVGIHGRYLCMYHNEPTEELTRGEMGAF